MASLPWINLYSIRFDNHYSASEYDIENDCISFSNCRFYFEFGSLFGVRINLRDESFVI